jgi:hypothetical protein
MRASFELARYLAPEPERPLYGSGARWKERIF